MATTWIRIPVNLAEEDHTQLVRAADAEGLKPGTLARMLIKRALREYRPVRENL